MAKKQITLAQRKARVKRRLKDESLGIKTRDKYKVVKQKDKEYSWKSGSSLKLPPFSKYTVNYGGTIVAHIPNILQNQKEVAEGIAELLNNFSAGELNIPKI